MLGLQETYGLTENEIAKIVVSSALKIHRTLGPGLFESVYESVLEYELVHVHQLEVRRQVPIPVTWNNTKMDVGFRSDLIIEGKVNYRPLTTRLRPFLMSSSSKLIRSPNFIFVNLRCVSTCR